MNESKWKAEAERIVSEWIFGPLASHPDGPASKWKDKHADLIDAIASALQSAARVKQGCVRTEDGVERRVHGITAITKDGLFVGHGETLWHPHSDFPLIEWVDGSGELRARGHGQDYKAARHVKDCYSTREAALSSRSPGTKEEPS